MSDLLSYIRYRLPVAGVYAVFLICAWVLCFLYELPVNPFVNLTYLSLSLCLVCAAVDLIKYKAKLGELRRGVGESSEISADNALEEEYLKQIKDIRRELRDSGDRSAARYNEMVEYYTIWAHQIKTPISALSLTAQNIDDDALRESLMTQIVRIEDYADMVMGYIRLGSESNDLVFDKQCIEDIVRQEIKKQRPAIVAKGLSLDFQGGEHEAVTDMRWLGFAIGQVLSNSIKYTSKGKITIICDNESVVIADEGIGIASEDLPRVFEKGYTGYNGRGDKKSTGIGLYLVKRTMDLLGGDIKIDSEVGKGTKVTLYLTKK
ncbi:MAG: sensor histidine kinase [Saccharofermentans sp.]|nr:sensor histidine kinase [Saccharofermentans sp.]